MGAIPGDENFARDVVVPHVNELGTRLADIFDDINGKYEGLSGNVQGIIDYIESLGLADDPEVQEAIQELLTPIYEYMTTGSEIIEKFVALAGAEVVLVDADEIETGDETATDNQEETATGKDDAASDSSESGEKPGLIPPELAGKSAEEVRELMGKNIYPLRPEELKGLGFSSLISSAEAIVAISDDGQTLQLMDTSGEPKTTSLPPATVIRCINMYNRLMVTDTGEFRKSDVSDIFGPHGGFSTMSKPITNTNDTLTFELGIPPLFDNNGLQKSAARYQATGKVLFLRLSDLTGASDETAA